MFLVVAVLVVVGIVLLVLAIGIVIAITAGAPVLALVLMVAAALVILGALRIRFPEKRMSDEEWEAMPRGATKEHYDPWIGGGLD